MVKKQSFLLLMVLVAGVAVSAMAERKLMSLYKPQPDQLKYHNGAVLSGDIPVSILWYGRFTPAQKAVVTDFVLSLAAPLQAAPAPSVSQWWGSIHRLYLSKAVAVGKNGGAHGGGGASKNARVVLSGQVSDEGCSLGKSLKLSQLPALAAKARPAKGGVALVLTAQDVAVEGFCMSRMVAGAVTNPFGDGFYQGERGAALEAATACTGVYGKGAYPGYAGELLVDRATGASYNAHGARGRKYLLPALFDPDTSACSTLV
uniref:Uncharacterized protein n=1 Tax=Oryza brachyantha TaxID=4533 RepID=J3MCI0_ORYBR